VTVDPSPLVACAESWRPNPKWASTVRGARDRLLADPAGLDAVAAWSDLIMMLGDTHAAPLALVCCLHAATLLPAGVEDRRLAAHRHLCVLDLGLGKSDGPIALKTLGDPDAIAERPGDLEAWTARALMPFDGDLAAAARFCLQLAAVRMRRVSNTTVLRRPVV